MQARDVNGYSETEINDALQGVVVGQVKLIPRFDVLDSDNQLLRATTNILSGSVRHRAQDQIKQTLSCQIREAPITLDEYPDMVIADGPLVYYRFGEPSGVTAEDSSPNNLDGVYNNTPSLNTPSLLIGDTTNGAITLDGVNENVSKSHVAAFNVSNLTVEAWIQTSSSGAVQVIAARDNTTTQKSWQFRLTSGGALEMVLWFSAVAGVYTSTASVNDGRAHHVVGTYNGVHAVLYVDSYRVLKTAETRALDSATVDLDIGVNAAGGQPFTGSVDEFAYYGRALSSAEVREHHQRGIANYEEIDYTRDRLKIYVQLKMNRNGDDGTPWAEWPLGVYLLSAPDREQVATGISRQVQGFDQTTVLLQSAVTDRYVILSTVNYITAISTLLTATGLNTTGYQLTPTTLTLPATRSWPLGTTRLQIINDLLASINYRPFRFNSDGVGIAEPDVLPKNRGADYTYSTDEFSVMIPDMRYTQNLFDVPNVVVLSNTQPKRNTITSTVTNNLLSSPTSVLRREGRKVYYVDGNFDAADQTTLDAAAANMLTRLSQPSEVWQFGTLAHPFHEDEDILTLTDDSGLYSFGISGQTYMELEWSLPFSDMVTGTMTHVAQRIVAVA